MSEPQDPTVKPARAPRRDAVRNDQRVLEAARAVFAERGLQAGMEEIAARAGVGVGTIYRRFPSKDALLDAIAELLIGEMDQAATDALADDDPARGLEALLEFAGRFNAEKSRYASVLLDRAREERASTATTEKVVQLVRKAVEAGFLAPDVRGEDVLALMVAVREVVTSGEPDDDEAWRRFIRIHLAGLRAHR